MKPKKDPNAPKRNLSTYLLYQNAMRELFKTRNPTMTFGQLSKYTSSMYGELSESEKSAWQSRAEADKTRYLMEMSTYIPPRGYDARGAAIGAETKPPARGGRKGPYTRDPNAPRRSTSSYLMYQNAKREQFKIDNPGMTFGQLSKYTSHMYKSLTPEEKEVWVELARKDKIRYDEEKTNYVAPLGHDSTGKYLGDKPQAKKTKKQKDPNAPKKSRGSYVFFTFDMRPQILLEDPSTKFTEVGSIMGTRWRALTKEQKKVYEDLADVDKIRFEREQEAYLKEKERKEVLERSNQEKHDVELQDFAALTASQQNVNFVQNANQYPTTMPTAMAMPTTMQILQNSYPSLDPNAANMIYYDPNQPYHFS